MAHTADRANEVVQNLSVFRNAARGGMSEEEAKNMWKLAYFGGRGTQRAVREEGLRSAVVDAVRKDHLPIPKTLSSALVVASDPANVGRDRANESRPLRVSIGRLLIHLHRGDGTPDYVDPKTKSIWWKEASEVNVATALEWLRGFKKAPAKKKKQTRGPAKKRAPVQAKKRPRAPVEKGAPGQAKKRPRAPVEKTAPGQAKKRPRAPVEKTAPGQAKKRPRAPVEKAAPAQAKKRARGVAKKQELFQFVEQQKQMLEQQKQMLEQLLVQL